MEFINLKKQLYKYGIAYFTWYAVTSLLPQTKEIIRDFLLWQASYIFFDNLDLKIFKFICLFDHFIERSC